MHDRETVIKRLEVVRNAIVNGYIHEPDRAVNAITDAIAMLKEQPEIVRCKDCKHATMTADGKMCKYCAMDTDDFGDQRDVYHDANWFCADGERR